MQNYVCYYRTSTLKQTLGIEAQKNVVNNYINNSMGKIVMEFTEQESGKNDERIELNKALDLCEKTKSILLIAKLDRLSRNISFLFNLRDRLTKSNTEIRALDIPNFNTLTLGVYATIAAYETELTSSRTIAALNELKKQGKKLGSPNNLNDEARKKGTIAAINNAKNNIRNKQAVAIILGLRKEGKNLSEISNYLNQMQYKTRYDKIFYPKTVSRLLKRNEVLFNR